MQERLEELVKRIIQNIDTEKFDERVETYVNYNSKYTVLKPSVKVEVELTCGKIFKFDVSDYFKEDIK